MALENAQLTTSQLDIFGGGVPANKRFAITSIMVCNTYDPSAGDASANTASFDMHFRKASQALSNSVTCAVRSLDLVAGETFTFDTEKVILDQGEELSFVAFPALVGELTNLAVSVSYLEV